MQMGGYVNNRRREAALRCKHRLMSQVTLTLGQGSPGRVAARAGARRHATAADTGFYAYRNKVPNRRGIRGGDKWGGDKGGVR